VNRVLIWVYRRSSPWVVMRWKKATIAGAWRNAGDFLLSRAQLGSEFICRRSNEGTLFYMPASCGMSITKAASCLQTQNKITRVSPEVSSATARPAAQYPTDPGPTECSRP